MAVNDTGNKGSGMGDKIVAAVLVFLIFGAGAYGVMRGLGTSSRREGTSSTDTAGEESSPEDKATTALTGSAKFADSDGQKVQETGLISKNKKQLSTEDIGRAFNTDKTFMIVPFTTEGKGSYRVDCDTVLYRFPTTNIEAFTTVWKGVYVMVTGISEGGSWAQISYAGGIYYIPMWCLTPDEEGHAVAGSVFVSGDITDESRFAAVLFTPEEAPFNTLVLKVNTYAKEYPSNYAKDVMPLTAGNRVQVEGISDNGWARVRNGADVYYINMAYLSFIETPDVIDDAKTAGEDADESPSPAESGDKGDQSSGKSDKKTKTTKDKTDKKTGSSKSGSEPSSADSKATDDSKSGSDKKSDKYPGTIDMKEAKKLLKLINDYREENGCDPLKWSSGLEKAAKKRAKEVSLTAGSKDPHTRPNGKPWYTVNPDLMYGENLAYGQVTAEEVFKAWKNSKEHNKTMLEPGYKIFAAALYVEEGTKYTYFWAQEFGY